MKTETKYLFAPFELKNVGAAGEVEGYASTFGNIDQGGDVVDPGAFRKTLKENKGKFPILSHHNPYKQIGWNLDAKEDEKGLAVNGWWDIANNSTALEHFSLAKKAFEIKASAGLSIGYMTIKAEPDKENPTVRRLKELKIVEYSPVTFPMNEKAATTRVKSAITDAFAQLDIYDDVGLEEGLQYLIDAAKSSGYPEDRLRKALQKFGAASTSKTDPVPADQSLLADIKSITKILKG